MSTPYGRLFHAHQADVHPELRAAMAGDAVVPAAAHAELLARVSLRLRGLFRTGEPVIMLPGSAAVLREIGLRAAVEHRALVLVTGPEGEALAAALEALGKEVVRLMVAPGRVVEAAHLARFLAGPEVDTVVLTHAEAGSGTLAPLGELARVVRLKRDVMLFVDASATLGGSPLETDQWGLDFVVGGSEGAVGLPPGLAFAAASPRLVARARVQAGRGHHLDLVAHHGSASRGQALGLVPPALLRALERQLERILVGEGLERRWARHAALAALVDAWEARTPAARLVAAAGVRAHTVSALELSPDVAAVAVASALAERGFHVTPATVGEPRRLRIGHMGDIEEEQLAALLAALGAALEGSGPRAG